MARQICISFASRAKSARTIAALFNRSKDLTGDNFLPRGIQATEVMAAIDIC